MDLHSPLFTLYQITQKKKNSSIFSIFLHLGDMYPHSFIYLSLLPNTHLESFMFMLEIEFHKFHNFVKFGQIIVLCVAEIKT